MASPHTEQVGCIAFAQKLVILYIMQVYATCPPGINISAFLKLIASLYIIVVLVFASDMALKFASTNYTFAKGTDTIRALKIMQ